MRSVEVGDSRDSREGAIRTEENSGAGRQGILPCGQAVMAVNRAAFIEERG